MEQAKYIGPTFLAIGPPKTATTWLYNVLKKHPDIHLPPMKEVGYFWEKKFLPNGGNLGLFFRRHWFYKAKRRYLAASLKFHFIQFAKLRPNLEKLKWDLNYFGHTHSDTWYSSLFSSEAISGDITPKYCELEREDLESIKSRFGAIKIVITLRDPIEREWSRAKMNLCKRHNCQPEEVPINDWFAHFQQPQQYQANDYVRLCMDWESVFGKDNILIIYFDEIQEDAWRTYNKLCQFLGLEILPMSYRNIIQQPVGVGIKSQIPSEIKAYLVELHKTKLLQMAETFPTPNYPLKWLERYGLRKTN